MARTVVVLATLDTKSEEAQYLKEQIEGLGGSATVMDIGVVGTPSIPADVTRADVAAAGGESMEKLLASPTREEAGPVMVAGATRILLDLIAKDEVHAVLGIGGTQGTSSCTQIMQALPYGFPKLMVSTVASGDTSPFVGIKDITMMFSVSDLLGVNRFTARILANAAAAAHGMAQVESDARPEAGDKPLIAMTNLGVLTEGANLAVELFREAGYDVVVFHAVGSGGQAMEQLMKEGVVGAVFDYAMGEIADDVFGGLRAGGPERLTVAGSLGLPQVICPGGAEHLGLFVEANQVPAEYEDHLHVFHSPVIFVPRLNREEFVRVAQEMCTRLQSTTGQAVMMLPLRGVGRYSIPGEPLHDEDGDRAFFDALRTGLPDAVEVIEMDAHAEDPHFVEHAVKTLIAMIEAR
ncbi:MAG: Tm-1-like ATP-binding domain-containing protein [Gemmatimonadota bacterium]|nr:Tm-1-like ATP-binding domain-containing protein [Gemmatimonadota bacterium]MDE3013678.1 Tm-1-like ATP-binding domain-containing protein [Gemmatimonadota bacterium]